MQAAPSVLVVEDDLVLKTLLEAVLGTIDGGLPYIWARTAEEAERFLESGNISMVISDIALMGDKNGVDLWDHCRKKYPAIPFLMTSGLQSPLVLRLIGKDRNAPPFLEKPFRLGQCREIVQRVFRLGRAVAKSPLAPPTES